MKRKFIAGILVAILVVGALFVYGNSSQGSAETTAQTEENAT